MEVSLVAENVFYSVGSKDILSGATIRADQGKITGLLGRNGSGKTTLLQCIFGAKKADECDVFFNNKKVRNPYTINGLLNYLPQKPFLPPGILVRDLVKDFGIDKDISLEHFPEMEAVLSKSVAQLSGGMERLISVLIILLADALFCFLDEPFSHIVPLHIEKIKQVILIQKRHKGIIIADHMHTHLLDISDQVYLLKEGKSILINDRNNLSLHGYLPQSLD